MNNSIKLIPWLAAGLLAAGIEVASAAEDDSLSGDWGGSRSVWRDRGVSADFGFKADALRNTGGGLATGTQTAWQLDARIAADLAKLVGWDGGSAYLQIVNDRGGRPNQRLVGSLMGVSNIEVGAASTRIYQAWVQQEALDGRLAVLFGLYPIDTEFAVVDSAGMFSHPAYGAWADMSLTSLPSIFPVAALGVRARGQSADGSTYVQAAVLDGFAGDRDQPKGTHVRFQAGDGAFAVIEIGVKSINTKERPQSPGKFAVGAWRYTTRAPDLIDVDADGNPLARRRGGAYILGERELARLGDDAGRGVTAFARVSGTDGNSTPIRRALNLGVRIAGPFAARPDDSFGIAWTRGQVGGKFRTATAAAGGDAAAREAALEIGYRFQINKWFAIQPQFQRIVDPGADRSTRRASLVGARIEVAL